MEIRDSLANTVSSVLPVFLLLQINESSKAVGDRKKEEKERSSRD